MIMNKMMVCCLFQTNGSKPSILENGVGTGNNLSSLPADCNLYCLEPNLECQHYVAKALERHPGVHLSKFVRGFAEDMREFEDNMFDAVICTFTMCSIRRPEKALSEIKRVLKPVSLLKNITQKIVVLVGLAK